MGISSKWVVGIDLFFQPQKYYGDTIVDETLHRSGWEQLVRLFFSQEEPSLYWNPGMYLTGVLGQTGGTEYRSRRVTLDFANTLFFTPRLIGSIGLSLGLASFPSRPDGVRSDKIVGATTTLGYRLASPLTLITALNMNYNLSNVAAYDYKRFVGSMSMNYRF
jgi:hypothetical protein